MGAVNAKVGVTNEQWKGTIGTEGGGVTNKNGERFMEFCAVNDLVIKELYSNTTTFITSPRSLS